MIPGPETPIRTYFPELVKDRDERKQRIALTGAALAPFAVDRDLVRVVAALLDVGVYRSLQRIGLSHEDAAAAIADVIQARLTHKS